MEAGRELDQQIAERIFGWVDFWSDHEGKYLMGYPPIEQAMGIEAERAHVPHYSTEISAAWEVVEHMRTQYDLRVYIAQTTSSYQVAINGYSEFRVEST